jgi:Fe-S-cluster containining protein
MAETARWYEQGLRFACTACGRCCGGAPGFVWVTEADVARLAKAKGLSPETFSKRYVRRVGGRLSLRERENGDCVMFEGKRCSVHEVKPRQCVTYPFWTEVVDRPEDWEHEAGKCPGIGTGPTFTASEIDAMRRGDEAPMKARRVPEPAPEPEPEGATKARWDAALEELGALYDELDAELPRHPFVCRRSGDCCDFDAYGHRLYATTLEAEWFFRHSPRQRQNPSPRLCPAWGADRTCRAREGRMLGCRTFFCDTGGGDSNAVHERYHRRIKDLHDRHGIPFRYADVLAWAAERRPAP